MDLSAHGIIITVLLSFCSIVMALFTTLCFFILKRIFDFLKAFDTKMDKTNDKIDKSNTALDDKVSKVHTRIDNVKDDIGKVKGDIILEVRDSCNEKREGCILHIGEMFKIRDTDIERNSTHILDLKEKQERAALWKERVETILVKEKLMPDRRNGNPQ